VVIRPTEDQVKSKNLPTTKQVVEALRAVPAGQRPGLTEVIISPVKDPKSPDSAADAGDGSVMFFPTEKAQSQNNFDNRLMHESGHNYQGSLWKETGAGPWESAATADDRRPPRTPQENYGEDFCEFIVLYNTAKGTSCEGCRRTNLSESMEKDGKTIGRHSLLFLIDDGGTVPAGAPLAVISGRMTEGSKFGSNVAPTTSKSKIRIGDALGDGRARK